MDDTSRPSHTHDQFIFTPNAASAGSIPLGSAVHVRLSVSVGGHNVTVTVKNAITSWWIKSITSPNPLNLEPRFAQMLDDFPLIHFRRRIHPEHGGKAVAKKH